MQVPTGAPPVGILLVASAVHSDAVSAVVVADDPFVAKDTFWRRKPADGAGAKTMATRGAMFLPNVMTVAVERRAFAAAVEISGGSCRPGAVVVSTRTETAGGATAPRSAQSRASMRMAAPRGTASSGNASGDSVQRGTP